jgi:hypothetical protein
MTGHAIMVAASTTLHVIMNQPQCVTMGHAFFQGVTTQLLVISIPLQDVMTDRVFCRVAQI